MAVDRFTGEKVSSGCGEMDRVIYTLLDSDGKTRNFEGFMPVRSIENCSDAEILSYFEYLLRVAKEIENRLERAISTVEQNRTNVVKVALNNCGPENARNNNVLSFFTGRPILDGGGWHWTMDDLCDSTVIELVELLCCLRNDVEETLGDAYVDVSDENGDSLWDASF